MEKHSWRVKLIVLCAAIMVMVMIKPILWFVPIIVYVLGSVIITIIKIYSGTKKTK